MTPISVVSGAPSLRHRSNGCPAGSARVCQLSLRRSRVAPSSTARAVPASRSGTRRSRWACWGYAGSGQRGGTWSGACCRPIRQPSSVVMRDPLVVGVALGPARQPGVERGERRRGRARRARWSSGRRSWVHPRCVVEWLAGRAPVRRPLASGRPLHLDRDRGAAAAARRPVAPVDPHPLPLAQVAGGRLDPALLVELEHLPGPADQAAQVGHRAHRGRRGARREVKQSSAAYIVPMPARLVWSSSASRIARVGLSGQVGEGDAPRPSRGRAGRDRGGRRRRPRGRAVDQLDDAEREADGGRPARSRAPPARCGPSAASAGPGATTFQLPSILRWVCSVHRSVPVGESRSTRVSRCLPRETVSTTVPPAQVGGGVLGDPEVGAGEHLPPASGRGPGRCGRRCRPQAR